MSNHTCFSKKKGKHSGNQKNKSTLPIRHNSMMDWNRCALKRRPDQMKNTSCEGNVEYGNTFLFFVCWLFIFCLLFVFKGSHWMNDCCKDGQRAELLKNLVLVTNGDVGDLVPTYVWKGSRKNRPRSSSEVKSCFQKHLWNGLHY